MKTNSFGLGTIELLVAVLFFAALGIGIWATFNPLEQFYAFEDKKTQKIATEIFEAFSRYYADRGVLPWPKETFVRQRPLSDFGSEVTTLIQSGMIRVDFVDTLKDKRSQKIFVTSRVANQVSVCFEPQSQSLKLDPQTIFKQDGQLQAAACKPTSGAPPSAVCYWCVR